MDQEYKADVCCPRNTSAAEVDNSVEKLIGDSTVRNVGHDELKTQNIEKRTQQTKMMSNTDTTTKPGLNERR
jgi:hypothetical protein